MKTPIDMTTGSLHSTEQYGSIEVVNYETSTNVKARFLNTGFEVSCYAFQIRKGLVKDRLSPSVHGVGFIGVGEFTSTHKGKNTLAYKRWSGMLERCYSDRYQKTRPTYIGCTVCDEWHNFQSFAKWFYDNYPDDGSEYHLDKDLKIIGNKVYSPETCLFVTSVVNSFITCCDKSRGEYKIGVGFNKKEGKFQSKCNNPFTGKLEWIGRFSTEIEAHLAWRKRKSELAYELSETQTDVDVKLYILRWKDALDGFDIHKV